MYPYAVDNGVRQITILLTKHIPSHLTIAGHRVLLSYDGQPATCYGCGEEGHMLQGCPRRRARKPTNDTARIPQFYAAIISHQEVVPMKHDTAPTTPRSAERPDVAATSQKVDGETGNVEQNPHAGDLGREDTAASQTDDPQERGPPPTG
jgi:hypothetical protein